MSRVSQIPHPVNAGTGGPHNEDVGASHCPTRYTEVLLLLFFLTLPLVNPWVRGDGVGYYAYLRSLLIEHRLDFSNDWRAANESFAMGRVRPNGSIDPLQYTPTGHLNNHYAVGAAILWAPFIVPVHGVMLTLQKLGIHANANGYSRPYRVTMAIATALYGFLGLLISFRLAGLYCDDYWAFLATVGIWFASSLPVYMYFNPSWSHAHSVFAVAVFLWYWQRTRRERSLAQWAILGLISGLVLDVYYANLALLLIPAVESMKGYWQGWRSPGHGEHGLQRLFTGNLVYCLTTVIAFLPTLVTRQILYGDPLELGYPGQWGGKPAPLQVLFSSDHGFLTWTPILVPALVGLYLLRQQDGELAAYGTVVFLAFFALISSYACWDGISSFGNRFFISLTPLYVLGLAVFFREFAGWLKNAQRARVMASTATALLVLWNLAFIFQWGTHMVPARGPISWKQMVRNQFTAVPARAATEVTAYFRNRGDLMRHIEQEDVRQLVRQESEAGRQ